MTDLLSERCGDLLTGSYDCPDRIVLNAYYQMGHAPGGNPSRNRARDAGRPRNGLKLLRERELVGDRFAPDLQLRLPRACDFGWDHPEIDVAAPA